MGKISESKVIVRINKAKLKYYEEKINSLKAF